MARILHQASCAGVPGARGGIAVRFAAAMLPMLLLAGALIDLGMAWEMGARMTSAARAGTVSALPAAGTPPAADLAAAEAAARARLAEDGIDADIAAERFCACADGSRIACGVPACGGRAPAGFVSILATGTYRPLLGRFLHLDGPSLQRSATVRIF